jgi:DNA-directed RNA polymerase II subunit RPB2
MQLKKSFKRVLDPKMEPEDSVVWWIRNKWACLSSYYQEYGLVRHQIETFNRFVLFDIDQIIRDEPYICHTRENGEQHVIKFFGACVEKPYSTSDDRLRVELYPTQARVADLTYECNLYVQAEECVSLVDGTIVRRQMHNRVLLAKIPCMLRSVVCHLTGLPDKKLFALQENPTCQGGYFIIHGKERVVIGQMRNVYNSPLCFWKGDDLLCEMRSISEESGHSVLISLKITSSLQILCKIPHVKEWFPLAILFKALANQTPDAYINVPQFQRYFTRMLLDTVDMTQSDAIEYIGRMRSRKTNTMLLLKIEIFPHLGIHCTIEQIVASLSLMTRQLLAVHCGQRSASDLYSYANKRVEMCGQLISDLFKMLYKKFLKTLTLTLEKQHRVEMNSLCKMAGITNGLAYSFATGNWGVQRNNYIRTGVSQVPHPKLSSLGIYSALRRIFIPSSKEGKSNKIRQLHPSSAFFVCPSETPEGQSVGVVLNMALLCHVSCKFSYTIIYDLIQQSFEEAEGETPVFVNGIFIRKIVNVQRFRDFIANCKRLKIIPYDVTYVSHQDSFEIFCDSGRFIRPVLKIQTLDRKPTSTSFKLLERMNLVEYVCPSQLEYLNVAIDPSAIDVYGREAFDYMELEASAMLGLAASFIPFSNHTQSPRICYQSSMSKQAIGLMTANDFKFETSSYSMLYLQKSLCGTKLSQAVQLDDEMANGLNAIVAIASYTGYNQEDSLIINKAALDRGLFTIQANKTLVVEEKTLGSVEKICLPPFDKRKLHCNYQHLDERGIVREKTWVTRGDVIVGKLVTRINKKECVTFDDSLVIKANEEGQILRVITSTGRTGTIVKVLLGVQKIPEIGDKFCSNSAQKGTCGMIFNQEDMPFTAEGIVPDIIINPHCIPSRMTINQLMACVVGKIKCTSNMAKHQELDGTPFENSTSFSQLCDSLRDQGYARNGCERLYNGMTGEMIEASIFIGPTYYFRLKHLVSDKIHARAQGQLMSLTRQPNCGRAKNGGLRIGEMEKDSLLVHGVSRFIRERMFELSDFFIIYVCRSCGIISASTAKCHVCDMAVYKCTLPYAAKLLLQELNGMGIKTKLEIK